MNSKATKRFRTSGRTLAVSVLLMFTTGTTMPLNVTDADETKAKREYPPGELGAVVRLGEEIVTRTAERVLSKQYVGNSLPLESANYGVSILATFARRIEICRKKSTQAGFGKTCFTAWA